MMRTRVKVCGVRTVAGAEAAVRAGADAVGLVFVSGSPRCVTEAEAAAVVGALPAFVEPVALFVDQPVERVWEVCRSLGIRTVQLHGDETPAEVAELAPLRVIKALPFDVRGDGSGGAAEVGGVTKLLDAWRPRPGNLCAILWDAPPDRGAGAVPAGQRGGTGRTVDWHALAKLQAAGMFADLPPMVLAGGLTPGNVAEAVRVVRPYAVDVSSGVEVTRGVKDAGRIEAFVAAVGSAAL